MDRTLEHLVEEELTRDQETQALVLSSLHMFDRLAYSLVTMMCVTVLLFVGRPLISIVHQIVRQTELRNYSLPYLAQFPWDVPSNGFLFHLHFLYELFISWFMAIANGGVDSLFGYYIFQISSVLRTMSFRLTNPPVKEEYLQLLRTCVNKHRQLLRCRAILEDVYGLIILWPVLTNAIVMCALVYEMTSVLLDCYLCSDLMCHLIIIQLLRLH